MNKIYKYRYSKYKLKAVKKVASYMLGNEEESQAATFLSLALNEAITIKKDPSKILDAYNPKIVEAFWQQWWKKQKYFHPDAQKVLKENKKPYTIVLPPPNVTGYLHIGHGLTTAIEDALIRRYPIV